MPILPKLIVWSKIIRDTFIKLLIILTILSAVYFWLFVSIVSKGTTEGSLAFLYLFVFSWSIVIVFLSGIVYYIAVAAYKALFKKEMSKVKVHVKNK
jgi:hypothetical protein